MAGSSKDNRTVGSSKGYRPVGRSRQPHSGTEAEHRACARDVSRFCRQ